MLKFLVKVSISLYLLNVFKDQIDTLHVVEISLNFYAMSSCPTWVKVTGLEILC